MPSQTPSQSFHIPTIDISPYLSDPSSIESLKIVHQVREACITTGFFQIINHGIPRPLQEAVFQASRAFFALDMHVKKSLDKSHSVGASNRGYEVLGNQGLQAGTLPDLKEGFYIGHSLPPTDPRVQRSAFLMGPNIWPPLAPPLFKTPMQEYYTRMYSLSLRIMDVLAAGLPYGKDVFETFVSNDAVASIRLLHYPPDPDEGRDERQLGAGAHTDFGAVTLLLQDECGGLQVWNDNDGSWVDVPPNKDAYVVNVGDMLAMWTSGKYKSGLHRVVNRGGKDRYSVPFFFDGNVECVLRPLDLREGEREGEKFLTVEEHMRERFGSTYGRGKKREDGVGNFNV